MIRVKVMNKPLYLEISKKSKVFSGRSDGEAMRKKLKLDIRDKDNEVYDLYIPDVFSINASFFLGCFGLSLKELGEQKFRNKYLFVTKTEVIKVCIEDGISRALRSIK